MSHHRITALSTAAVFEALRNLTSSLSPQYKSDSGSPRPISLSGAPPSADVARLLLHVALEDKGLLLNSQLSFYLFAHGHILRSMTGVPNTSGFDTAATNLMAFMQNRIQLFYDNGVWEIICSTEIRQVKEIRDLVKKIQPEEAKVIWKNVIIGSTIHVGGDMTVGDVTKIVQHSATAAQTHAFVQAAIQLVHQGQLYQAIKYTLDFSKDTYPDLYKNVLTILPYLIHWNEQRGAGVLTEDEINMGWQGMSKVMLDILNNFLKT
jgi:hypothetical protein